MPEHLTRILGIDFGLRRVGVAVSDFRKKIATPVEVYGRRDAIQDARYFKRLVEENDAERIVLGFPFHTSGNAGTLAVKVREWGTWLAETTGCPVAYYDERYSTAEADAAMRSAGLKSKDRKAKVDMLAARILLQNYLDDGCPESIDVSTLGAPLADEPPKEAKDD